MIANITKGSFLKPLIEYNEKKIREGQAKLLAVKNTFGTIQNVYENAKKMIQNFGSNSKRKDKFFHVSINFPVSDKQKITSELMENIAAEYMKKMGFSEIPYVVYEHQDTKHPHIHIVSSNIDSQGKAIAYSNEWKLSQSITRELEKKYGLTLVSSEKQNVEKVEVPSNFSSLKEELNYHIKNAIYKYRVQNFTDFQKYLNDYNLDIYHLTGLSEYGKGNKATYNGVVFFKNTTDFKKNQKGIKASSLYLKPTYERLEKAFKRNVSFHKARRKEIKGDIDFILSSYNRISLVTLQSKLEIRGIKFTTKYDSTGLLVGVSFTDMKTGHTYTGEKIGKGYTAKNIRGVIADDNQLKPEVITTININKFKNHFERLNSNQKIQTLIALGFRVVVDNDSVYISDYKNNQSEGYIKFLESKSINPTIVSLYKSSKNIDFNNLTSLNKLHFEYNRAKFNNDHDRMEQIISYLDNQTKNRDDMNLISPRNYLDGLYHDVYQHQNIVEDQHTQIADIDKSKKKKPRKRRF